MTAKTPAVYYTYDRHGDLIEIASPVQERRGPLPAPPVQTAMPIGGPR